MKNCAKCRIEKPLSGFELNKQLKSTGYKSWCNVCDKKYHSEYSKKYSKEHRKEYRARAKKYYDRNPEIRHSWALKYKYGITKEAYETIFRNQSGVCAICSRQNLDGKRLCVDHNHTTGTVRGLLCRQCNYFIGCINESKESAAKLLGYLEKHENTCLL